MTAVNPSGLCLCGCGEAAPIAAQTYFARGWVKGQHLRYVRGHVWRVVRGPRPRYSDAQVREVFWSNVEKTETCWLWVGAMGTGGYGRASVYGKRRSPHRVAYEWLVGPIPEGLQLDHLCRVRNCVRPDHLEPVTQRENNLRGGSFAGTNAAKTHCIRGHPFDEANTIKSLGRDGVPWRACRACKRMRRLRTVDA